MPGTRTGRRTSNCAVSSFVLGHRLLKRDSGDQPQACSTPGCCRPRRYWRIHRETFSGEQVCCPDGMVPPAGTTATNGEHVHSMECNAREAARSQQQPSAPLPTPTPPPAPAARAPAATPAPAPPPAPTPAQQPSAPLPTPTPPPAPAARAPAATPAPAPPPAPTPAQVREAAWAAIREGPPPLTLPYSSEQWLVRHQQWMLRQRRQHPEVGERYCWEGDVPADGASPPRHRTARDVGNGAYVSKHATSVARMNDGTTGGSARSHNDD